MTNMKKHLGDSGSFLIAFLACLFLFLVSAGFAAWAYMGRQDYKNNSDQKAAAAVEVAKKQTASEKDNEFLEKEKFPLKNFKGPAAYGTVSLQYPKTWSGYVEEKTSGLALVDSYFHPDFVPSKDSETAFALRIQVVNTPYDQELKSHDARVKTGKTQVSAYRLPKVDSVLGARVTGEIDAGRQQGSLILLPLRDKTLKIFSEGSTFQNDFNTIILANLTFVP
jgi:hypothetical protein